MMQSIRRKKRLFLSLWLVGVLGLAALLFCKVTQPEPGCRAEDLTRIPDDALMVFAAKRAQPAAAPAQDGAPATDGPKRVFLTFDDGPSATTETVLDILKEEGVPATFFVVAAENNEKYLPLLQRTVAEGHQIALHSCSHEYRAIYKNPAAYWADLKALRAQIAPYVPDAASIKWIRFPGGSTNTVSHKYGGSNIMKSLKAQAEEKGYHYVDWNVCAEDAAGGHPSASEIYHNVVDDVGDKTVCVVLMHDTRATKNTAEALPDIIHWFMENGFEFCTVSALESAEEG